MVVPIAPFKNWRMKPKIRLTQSFVQLLCMTMIARMKNWLLLEVTQHPELQIERRVQLTC